MKRAQALIERFEQQMAEQGCPDNVCTCGGDCGCTDRPIAATDGPATSLDAVNAVLDGEGPAVENPDAIGEDGDGEACCAKCAATGGCCQKDDDDDDDDDESESDSDDDDDDEDDD